MESKDPLALELTLFLAERARVSMAMIRRHAEGSFDTVVPRGGVGQSGVQAVWVQAQPC